MAESGKEVEAITYPSTLKSRWWTIKKDRRREGVLEKRGASKKNNPKKTVLSRQSGLTHISTAT